MNYRILAFVTFSILLQSALHAQQASLSASTNTPIAGEPFALSLTIQANQQIGSLGALEIDGLELDQPRFSQQMSWINGKMSVEVSHTYTAIASEVGDLEIPPITITIGQTTLQTAPLKLSVQKGSGVPQPRLSPGIPIPPPGLGNSAPANPNSNAPPPFPSKIDETAAFLKVIPDRDAIYVGETVEVEIKAFFDAGMPIANYARELTLKGEDFITRPTVGPDTKVRNVRGRRVEQAPQERIDGRLYNVLTYRTVITAVKPGEFTLAPIDYTAVIEVPISTGRRTFADSFFSDSLFANTRRELRMQSKAVDVKVLPLPTEGRPEDFYGAIGRFSMDVATDKQSLQVDEALKVTATITGYGNFERISQLSTASDPNWKAYPPKSQFSSEDELGIGGEKTFEYTYIATGPTDQAPPVSFAFFDPESKKYVSLGGQQLPVSVTGMASPALTNQDLAVMADQAISTESPIIKAMTATDRVRFASGRSLRPMLGSTSLLAFNGGAAALALGLAIWQWRRQDGRQLSPKQRLRQLLNERGQIAARLEHSQDANTLNTSLLRYLALHQHVQGAGETILSDNDAALRTIASLPETSSERIALEDFMRWSTARQWSGASHSQGDSEIETERRHHWIQAAKALENMSIAT